MSEFRPQLRQQKKQQIQSGEGRENNKQGGRDRKD